jgi:hypothetical protein
MEVERMKCPKCKREMEDCGSYYVDPDQDEWLNLYQCPVCKTVKMITNLEERKE